MWTTHAKHSLQACKWRCYAAEDSCHSTNAFGCYRMRMTFQTACNGCSTAITLVTVFNDLWKCHVKG